MRRHRHRFLLGAGILLILVLPALSASAARSGPASASADGQPISLDGYWELVARSHQVVSGLASLPPLQSQSALEALVREWEAVRQVELEDGSVVPLDNSFLLQALRSGSADTARPLTLLETLLEAHRQHPGRLFTVDDLTLLNAILAEPQFQWKQPAPNPLAEWLQGLWDSLGRWLEGIFGEDGEVFIPAQGFAEAFPYVTALLLILVLFYMFRGLYADLALEARGPGDEAGAAEVLSADSAFARAQVLSRGGDFRSAVRYLYLSSLLLLDERGLLRYDRSKTNREVLRAAAQSPALAEPLKEVIDVFDNVWYGYHSLDEASFQHYSDRVRELKEKQE